MSQTIRFETPEDVAAIHALTAAAFLLVPHSDNNEQFIVDALRSADALTMSLVAQEGSEIVGHVAVSPVTISDGSAGWFGLGPISVRPDRQGQGIGTLLIKRAMQWLQESGGGGCVLLGSPDYYSRFGFAPRPGLLLTDVPPEYFQALSFSSAFPRGAVTYHSAFSARS